MALTFFDACDWGVASDFGWEAPGDWAPAWHYNHEGHWYLDPEGYRYRVDDDPNGRFS